MSLDAWNKITQTHDLFKKIIAPLKEHLGINFGYMIVFNDGSYYQIIEDLDCLKKWVSNVETSHIFCARNVTTYFDEPYNFTIWPEEPTCPAMEIYKEYGMWNGITVSKVNKDYTELYWFTKQNTEDGWHKWFVRNKQFLLQFIQHFENNKILLCKNELKNNKISLFKFKINFINAINKSEYIASEAALFNKVGFNAYQDIHMADGLKQETTLSPREIEVLCIIGQGFPIKIAAQKLLISVNTVKYHLEHIREKTGVQSKVDFINFYKKLSSSIII